MTYTQMWLILGAAALVAGIAILFWLAVARADRRNKVPMCPYCPDVRQAHNGVGCQARHGDGRCKCTAPYGEPR